VPPAQDVVSLDDWLSRWSLDRQRSSYAESVPNVRNRPLHLSTPDDFTWTRPDSDEATAEGADASDRPGVDADRLPVPAPGP
jgi:hypothetical protein